MLSFANVTDVEQFIGEHSIEYVSFYLTDIDGRLRNVTIPAKNFSEKTLELGIGFDAINDYEMRDWLRDFESGRGNYVGAFKLAQTDPDADPADLLDLRRLLELGPRIRDTVLA